MTDYQTGEMGGTTAPAFTAYTALPPAEQFLEQHLGESAPVKLPESYREGFAKFLPWLTLIFLPIHIASVLLLFGITALAMLFGSFGWLSAIFSAGVLVCDIIALPGLFKRARSGWAFFVYALAIGLVQNLISFSFFGLVMSVLLFWLAFQIKYLYR